MKIPELFKPYIEGKYGQLLADICHALVVIGEANGAERMVPITSAHTSTIIYYSAKETGLEFLDEVAASGVRFKVPTSVDPISIDIQNYCEIGIPEEYAAAQMRSVKSFAKMGGLGNYTCTPWTAGNVPHKGDHIAWVDTSALIYANSVLGARSNRNVDPTAVAAAITGYVPEYGLHLEENRKADCLINVEASLESLADYAMLGTFAAKKFPEKNIAFIGLENKLITDDIYHHIGPAMSTWGNIALYHVIGHTPEAETLYNVWDNLGIEINFSDKDLETLHDEFSPKVKGKQFVVFGCPHCTLSEIESIAKLLEDKKIKQGNMLWVMTNSNTLELAKRNGYYDVITKSGSKVLADMCWVLSQKTDEIFLTYDSIVTDSTKGALLSRSVGKPTYVKDKAACIADILE